MVGRKRSVFLLVFVLEFCFFDCVLAVKFWVFEVCLLIFG